MRRYMYKRGPKTQIFFQLPKCLYLLEGAKIISKMGWVCFCIPIFIFEKVRLFITSVWQ